MNKKPSPPKNDKKGNKKGSKKWIIIIFKLKPLFNNYKYVFNKNFIKFLIGKKVKIVI